MDYQPFSEFDLGQLTHINIVFCNPNENVRLYCNIPEQKLKSIIPSMFIYNAICVMSDLSENRAGTITSGEDRYIDQMEELLHIGFIKDGREIPPEISEDNVVATVIPKGKDKSNRCKAIAALIHSWASIKDSSGEIRINEDKSGIKYCRFTSDPLSVLLPDTSEANSGWVTQNHYFFEIINDAGKQIYMQLAFSSKNMPSELLRKPLPIRTAQLHSHMSRLTE